MKTLIIDQTKQLKPQIENDIKDIISGNIEIQILERGSNQLSTPNSVKLKHLVNIAKQYV